MTNPTRQLGGLAMALLLTGIAGRTVETQAEPTIGGFVLVSEVRVSRTVSEYTYRATLTAGPSALGSASANATSVSSATTIVDGAVSFGAVGAGGTILSTDTFRFRHNRTVPFSWAHLRWQVTAVTYTPAEGVVLAGAPSARALDALVTHGPTPARDVDVVNGVILTRLDVALDAQATVAQVNAALAMVGGGIAGMAPGSAVVTVAVPRQDSREALQALADLLEVQPGLLWAVVGRTAQTDVVPPTPADTLAQLSHLYAARFPAAWNAARAASCPTPADRVTVLVADGFGITPPGYADAFATQVAVAPFTTASIEAYHGYDVYTTLGAAFDATAPTGANPFPACMTFRAAHVLGNVTERDRAYLVRFAIPDEGKVIVNQSWGFTKCEDPCEQAAAAEIPSAFERAQAGAEQRRILRGIEDRVLVTTTAGNNGNKMVRDIYPGAALADYNSPANIAARSDSLLTWMESDLLWSDPCNVPPCYSSLAAGPAERAQLNAWLVQWNETQAVPSANVLVVGSNARSLVPSTDDWELVPSLFSSPDGDVFAVGEEVPTLSGGFTAGTSFSAPQVAGLASYLWTLSPTLREAPVADTIALIRATVQDPTSKAIDAYAAVLALDPTAPPTPATSRIRLALLDVDNDDDRFDEIDLASFHTALLPGGQVVEPAAVDGSRYDLNGDGYTGGTRTARFDLDPTGSTPFGAPSLTTVPFTLGGETWDFDEGAVTDLEILCYYAYSAMYVGDTAVRDELLANRCVPLTVTVTPANVALAPGETATFTAEITGAANPDVTWTAGGGTIDTDGTFTAGDVEGTFVVRATSVLAPDVYAEASVTIQEEDIEISPGTFVGQLTQTLKSEGALFEQDRQAVWRLLLSEEDEKVLPGSSLRYSATSTSRMELSEGTTCTNVTRTESGSHTLAPGEFWSYNSNGWFLAFIDVEATDVQGNCHEDPQTFESTFEKAFNTTQDISGQYGGAQINPLTDAYPTRVEDETGRVVELVWDYSKTTACCGTVTLRGRLTLRE